MPNEIATRQVLVCIECSEMLAAGPLTPAYYGPAFYELVMPYGPDATATVHAILEHERQTGHLIYRKEDRIIAGSTHDN